jgi:hypothetical protein
MLANHKLLDFDQEKALREGKFIFLHSFIKNRRISLIEI